MNLISMLSLISDPRHLRQQAGSFFKALAELLPAPALLAFGLLFALLFVGSHVQAATLAGTTIGNQASATYSDGSATLRTVTSNSVVTTVTQVGSVTLQSSNTKTVSVSGLAYYPHTVTNTGNGPDTFTLSQTASGSFAFTTTLFYPDADGDGVPDNLIPITTTGPLVAGQVFKFVAAGTVPATATSGNTNTMVVKALGSFNAAQATATDVTTVTGQAVISVTQSIDQTSGPSPSSTSRTITVTYTNTGNATATGVVLSEPIPAGFTYVPASARWSVTGSTTLTDLNAEDQGGIAYVYDTPSTTATATIASVLPGTSATVSFKVDVKSNLAPGANPLTAATGTYAYNDGAAAIAAASTNTVQYTVVQAAALTFTPSVTVPSAAQGSSVSFTHVLTNLGNGTDSFDLSTSSSTFPAGTVFQFYRPDGITPLLDTNGNVFPDSGPILPAGNVSIVVKAILPPGGTGGPYSVSVTATSKLNPAITASVTDALTSISTSSVDLTNLVGGVVTGAGAGPETPLPALTQTVAPGGTTRFTLVVNNGSSVADSFGLQASTDVNFGSQTLPAGWTVTFSDGNAAINGTGVINASGSKTVYADVTVPAGSATSTTDLYFRALSPTTGASDRLHDAVTIGSLRALTLTPDQNGQVVAGGTRTYSHILVNTGTVTEGAVAGTAVLSVVDGTTGFSSVIYWDKNNDGVLDANDPLVTDLSALTGGSNGANTTAGLAPTKSARLFVKVTAPAGATVGTSNVGRVTLTMTGALGGAAAPAAIVALDNSQVIASQVVLVILQALDLTCSGTLVAPLSIQPITTAQPGNCIRYSITATNAGAVTVNSLTVFNATPAYTVYHDAVPAAATAGVVTAPTNGTAGTVKTVVGDLVAGGVVTLTYGARIQP